jgi:hypothetical protein
LFGGSREGVFMAPSTTSHVAPALSIAEMRGGAVPLGTKILAPGPAIALCVPRPGRRCRRSRPPIRAAGEARCVRRARRCLARARGGRTWLPESRRRPTTRPGS